MAPLRAIVSKNISEFLTESGDRLFEWVRAFGSPVFLLFPEEFSRNIKNIETVLQQTRVDGSLFFATKVNKSETFVEAAVANRIGIDAASLQELRSALGHGCRGNSIVVSGSDKSDRLLSLAIRHDCFISIDSALELRRLAALNKRLQRSTTTRILIRLSGFLVTADDSGILPTPKIDESRFGVPLKNWQPMLELLSHSEIREHLAFVGFNFHIDNHELSDRANAILSALRLGIEARNLGHPFSVIDAGGGLPIQYVSHDDWKTFVSEYSDQTTFRQKQFGLKTASGDPSRGRIYPHDVAAFNAGFLSALLAWKSPEGSSLARLLRTNGVRLFLEPGRSLLDQAGATVCLIKGMRLSSSGAPLLALDMNISHLWDQIIGSEFMVDPLHLKRTEAPATNPVECHLVGNLCLESDVIAWRRVPFSSEPQQGDLLIFPNTAGYQMDFIESRMHQLPLPHRLAIYNVGEWRWCLDEVFDSSELVIGTD